MMTDRETYIYDTRVELEIATTEESSLVRAVASGSWEDILNGILFARTGYRTLEQFFDEDEEQENLLFFLCLRADTHQRAVFQFYQGFCTKNRSKFCTFCHYTIFP